MVPYLYTIIDKQRISDMLKAFYTCVGLPIQVIDDTGALLESQGDITSFCSRFHPFLPNDDKCSKLHARAGKRAMELGETYIFSCHANLNHIVFPLINKNALFGSTLVGPFLMDEPDSLLISDLSADIPSPPIPCWSSMRSPTPSRWCLRQKLPRSAICSFICFPA